MGRLDRRDRIMDLDHTTPANQLFDIETFDATRAFNKMIGSINVSAGVSSETQVRNVRIISPGNASNALNLNPRIAFVDRIALADRDRNIVDLHSAKHNSRRHPYKV